MRIIARLNIARAYLLKFCNKSIYHILHAAVYIFNVVRNSVSVML